MLQHGSLFYFFLWSNNIPSYGYTTFCLSMYVSVNGYLSCFIQPPFGYYERVFSFLLWVELLGHMGNSMFNCSRNCKTVFQSDYTVSHSHQRVWRFRFLCIPARTSLFISATLLAVKWYLAVVLICIFLMTDFKHLFINLLTICINNILGKMFAQILCPFLLGLFSFWVVRALYIF